MVEDYQPGKVNKDAVTAHFHTSPEKLSQPYRNIVGKLQREEKTLFLKLATDANTISDYNRNEAEIYKRREGGRYPLPVQTPTLVEQGTYEEGGNNHAWFITEYIDSKEILTLGNTDEDTFRKHLTIIIDTTIAIMDWPQEPAMLRDVSSNQVAKAVIKQIGLWIQERLLHPNKTKSANAIELQKIYFTDELALQAILETGPSHGDFVPNNFRITPTGELYLMDMEHTRMHWLKFYDAAYMYHRLYTKHKKFELAQLFLRQFVERYSFNHSFDERAIQNIRIALAQRLIGGYFDAVEDGITNWKLQDELSEKLLRSKKSLDILK